MTVLQIALVVCAVVVVWLAAIALIVVWVMGMSRNAEIDERMFRRPEVLRESDDHEPSHPDRTSA